MLIKFAKKWSATFVGVFAEQWKFFTLLFFVSSIVSFLWIRHDLKKERINRNLRVHEKILEDREEARAEALRRNGKKSAPDPSVRVASTDSSNLPTQETEQQPSKGPNVEVIDGVTVVTSGTLKGMTLEAVNADANQKRLETIAAAKKRREWELQRDALKKRYLANVDKLIASAKVTLSSADAELEVMLSLFKLMSPEQLEYAREEALKTLPAEKVEAFFDDLANHQTIKTHEQLTKDAQDILKSREAQKIIDREIRVEREQIALEEEELKRTEPPIPW